MINKEPFIRIPVRQPSCWEGYVRIAEEIKQRIANLNKKKIVIAVECNQGTYEEDTLDSLKRELLPNVTVRARDVYREEQEIRDLVRKVLSTKSRVARMAAYTIEDYFDDKNLESLRGNIDFIDAGVILVHGIGAHLIWEPDILIYADMSRWELMQRFRRKDISNIGVSNREEGFDLQNLWSYCIDSRICNRIKKDLIRRCDYFLETNNWQKPKLISGNTVREGLELATRQPFFMAPFFDPELWDGEVSEPNKGTEEFELGFNCNAEENNLLFKVEDSLFEIPVTNLIYSQPTALLGEDVFRKHGDELPVYFEFVDTSEGKNLCIETFAGPEFLGEYFGQKNHQHVAYYVLSGQKGSCIHIGLKKDVSVTYFKQLLNNHERARVKEITSSLNKVSLKAHDFVTVPPETILSNGQKSILLRINTASPIFRYELFRQKSSQKSLLHPQTESLIDRASQKLAGDYQLIGSTREGEVEFQGKEGNAVSIRQFWLQDKMDFPTARVVSVFNLVEGQEILVEGDFAPFTVHHSESFIIPAAIGGFSIQPLNGGSAGLLQVMPAVNE